jgi:hypothetical protein
MGCCQRPAPFAHHAEEAENPSDRQNRPPDAMRSARRVGKAQSGRLPEGSELIEGGSCGQR